MNLIELQELVSRGEGQRLEFKLKATFPEKIAREMVAFANSDGGRIIVGVDDDGRIAGLKFADEEQFVIEKAVEIHIVPSIRYKKEMISLNLKRSVLVYHIDESKRKPVYYIEKPAPDVRGEAYIRLKDRSMKASREMVQILKRGRGKKSRAIQIGQMERRLFQIIEIQGKATVEDFIQTCGLTRSVASQKLVDLVTSNILDIVVEEKCDYYIMKTQEL